MGQLSKFHTVRGKRMEYSQAEFDRYSEAAGKGSHDAVAALIGSPGWQAMSPDGQRKAIKKAIDAARDEARAMLPVGALPSLPGSLAPRGLGRKDDLPPGYVVEGHGGASDLPPGFAVQH